MISVVIPALDEETAIAVTIASVSEVLTAASLVPFEIVVVDDGSSDQTGKIAASAGAKVIRHPHNIGYGRSLKNGIAAAQHDMIADCDADGTYPASAIPELVRLHREGYDMAVGRRQGPHYRRIAAENADAGAIALPGRVDRRPPYPGHQFRPARVQPRRRDAVFFASVRHVQLHDVADAGLPDDGALRRLYPDRLFRARRAQQGAAVPRCVANAAICRGSDPLLQSIEAVPAVQPGLPGRLPR